MDSTSSSQFQAFTSESIPLASFERGPTSNHFLKHLVDTFCFVSETLPFPEKNAGSRRGAPAEPYAHLQNGIPNPRLAYKPLFPKRKLCFAMDNANSVSIEACEDVAVNKRYEGLVTVRTKGCQRERSLFNGEPADFRATPLASPSSRQNHRKRSSQSQQPVATSLDVYPLNMVDSSRFNNEMSPKPLVLSGGKEDFGPLALLENSVKKLKSPKSSPCPALSKDQVNTAFDFLADWFYESCGHAPVIDEELSTGRLDSKFEEARMGTEAKIRDAAFFQVASDGWKSNNYGNVNQRVVKFMVNLPNGTRVFQKAVYVDGGIVPSQYAEEVLWETVRGICGDDKQRCVGIVADKYKAKTLRNLEFQSHWMVNLSCQLQGFFSLIKDFYRELPLFRTVSDSCMKIANLINSTQQIRNSFHKFRLQGLDIAGFIRVPSSKCDISKNLGSFIAMLDDLLRCSRILHLIVLDESYKAVCSADHSARETGNVIQDVGFWNDVEAAHSLVKMIMGMAEEIEADRPDASGKYLPPFKCLTQEQEKDVDKLVTRLVSKDEAHIALMELMKWRSEGLDPLYAQAVQIKQRDTVTGKMKIANPQSSRLVWETCLKEFKSLGKVAVRLLFLHATSCGIKCDWSFTRWFCGQGQSRSGLERAQKLVFVAAHAKLERRDFSSGEEKDVELFDHMSGEDEMLNEHVDGYSWWWSCNFHALHLLRARTALGTGDFGGETDEAVGKDG
ncbi:hypothetical protein DH2020_010075 [Rehmannia glutinosa]|uniref:Uncharacterized protein n=1 Tax=Rehmannia glutinosa TaxID=99300 RepID=A0ABR0X836_REHGL